jgi:hypothetical protein
MSLEMDPETYVADIGEAYDLATQEDQGYDMLAEKGLSDMGNEYFRMDTGDGRVFEGTGREALAACPYLGNLPSKLIQMNLETMRVDPAIRRDELAELNRNLG